MIKERVTDRYDLAHSAGTEERYLTLRLVNLAVALRIVPRANSRFMIVARLVANNGAQFVVLTVNGFNLE
jgi:hypothetical protein